MAAPPTAIEQRVPSEPDAAANIVVFENVSIAFDEKPVLDGISFRLAKGETKAIFGVAGSGKSTILKLDARATETGCGPHLRSGR